MKSFTTNQKISELCMGREFFYFYFIYFIEIVKKWLDPILPFVNVMQSKVLHHVRDNNEHKKQDIVLYLEIIDMTKVANVIAV